MSRLILFTTTSCMVTHRGGVSSSTLLPSDNYYIACTASRTPKRTILLGFSTTPMDLVAQAKHNLYSNHPLKSNESFANFSTYIKQTYFLGIVQRPQLTVSEDVIQYLKLPR